eukprot:gene16733-14599_t
MLIAVALAGVAAVWRRVAQLQRALHKPTGCEFGSHAAAASPRSQPTVPDASDVSEGIVVY